jgi:hypothetical protein
MVAKAGDAVAMVKSGKTIAATARTLGIGRGSVYMVLDAAGVPYGHGQSPARYEGSLNGS